MGQDNPPVWYAVEVVGSAASARRGQQDKKKKGGAHPSFGLCKGDLVEIERRLFEICRSALSDGKNLSPLLLYTRGENGDSTGRCNLEGSRCASARHLYGQRREHGYNDVG